MAYIIFLLTIQAPFLYFIWKLFERQSLKLNRNLQILKKQAEHIANFMDTLRMSVEKISDDIYSKKGILPSKLEKMERELKEIKHRLQQVEVYTGLNTNNPIEDLGSSPFIKDKAFR